MAFAKDQKARLQFTKTESLMTTKEGSFRI